MDNQNTTTVPTDLSDKEAVSRFIDQIIEGKGLGELGEAEKADLKDRIEEKLIHAVNSRLIFALPKEKFDEIEELVTKSDNYTVEQIIELVNNSGIDTEKVVAEALADFRKAILEEEA